MKRYLIFAGDDYYPTGGWGDFRADAETLEEARELTKLKGVYGKSDWTQIVDTETGEEVT